MHEARARCRGSPVVRSTPLWIAPAPQRPSLPPKETSQAVHPLAAAASRHAAQGSPPGRNMRLWSGIAPWEDTILRVGIFCRPAGSCRGTSRATTRAERRGGSRRTRGRSWNLNRPVVANNGFPLRSSPTWTAGSSAPLPTLLSV